MTDQEIIDHLRKDVKAKNRKIENLQRENKELRFRTANLEGKLEAKNDLSLILSKLTEIDEAREFIAQQQKIIFELNRRIDAQITKPNEKN